MMTKFAYPSTVKEAAQVMDRIAPGWETKVSSDRLRMRMDGEDLLSQVFGSFNKGVSKFAHVPKNAENDKVFGSNTVDRWWKRAITARLQRRAKANGKAETNSHASNVEFGSLRVTLAGQTHELGHGDIPGFVSELEKTVERLKQVSSIL
jgi:hypothetical protein